MQTMLNLRKNLKLTQKEVADNLGISRQAYANYETGAREPDLNMLIRLSEFFGVTIDYLLGNSEKEKPANEGELSEDIVIYHRDGKSVTKHFTKEQMDMLVQMIEALPEKPKDI